MRASVAHLLLALMVSSLSVFLLFAEEQSDGALHNALAARDYDEAIRMIRLGADVNELSGDGERPLTIAAANRSADAFDVVRELLKYGAATNEVNESGLTALQFAAKTGNLAVVDLLVRYGADVSTSTTMFNPVLDRNEVLTPLVQAYSMGHLRVAEYLESMGAERTDNLEAAKQSGLNKRALEANAEVPTPEGVSEDEWSTKQTIEAYKSVDAGFGEWMEKFYEQNSESLKRIEAVLQEEKPEEIGEEAWARYQLERVKMMQQTGEAPLQAPE